MRSPLAVLAVLVALVAGGFAADRLLGPVEASEPPPVVVEAAAAGAWYCAVGDSRSDNQLRVTTAAPQPGARTAEVRVDLFWDGGAQRGPEAEVFPGSAATRVVAGGLEDPGLTARWWRTPVAAYRSWSVGGTTGPRGLVEGPCEPAPSHRWVVPGLTTTGGAEAYLVVANPFDTDATLGVRFATPAGVVEPILLQNVVVSKRSVREIPLNRYEPEQPDLGVLVEVRSGRVVAEAYQAMSAAVGGIEGTSLARASPATAETWMFPWFPDDEASRSWLWVTNPSAERDATITVSLHTAQGGFVADGVEEIVVGPGEVRRIDLRGLLPAGGAPRGGVTVRSDNGIPVVAALATLRTSETAERSGIAIQLGAPVADSLWVLGGRTAGDRREFLHVLNPTSEPAVVDATLWTGVRFLAPEALRDVAIPPGAVVALDVGSQIPGDTADLTVFVTAREGRVVASREAFAPEGRLDLVAGLGVASRTWVGGRPAVPVQFDPGLSQRVDTLLGPRLPDDPIAPGPDMPQDEDEDEPIDDDGGAAGED